MKPENIPAALEEYADALRSFDAVDLETGWKVCRNANKRGFWPSIGLLVDACQQARHSRVKTVMANTPAEKIIGGRMIDGKVQPWGGDCACPRCGGTAKAHERAAVRSPGFYVAPREFAERSNTERRQADDWLAYNIERLPERQPGEAPSAYRKRLAGLTPDEITTANTKRVDPFAEEFLS